VTTFPTNFPNTKPNDFAGVRVDLLTDGKLSPLASVAIGAGNQVQCAALLPDGRFLTGGSLVDKPRLLWLGPNGALLGEQILAHPTKPATVVGVLPRKDGTIWVLIGLSYIAGVRVVRLKAPAPSCP